ncbi:unnamed protein product, partial [Gulo gulo]
QDSTEFCSPRAPVPGRRKCWKSCPAASEVSKRVCSLFLRGWVSRGHSASPWDYSLALCFWWHQPQPLSNLTAAATRSNRSPSAIPTRLTCPSLHWSRWRLTLSPSAMMGPHSWPQGRLRNRT